VAKYEVFIKPSAAKELEGVGTKKDRQRIVAHIRELTETPRLPGSRKLSGSGKYRLRCGNDRIVYSFDDDQLLVQVVKIGHRREVYR